MAKAKLQYHAGDLHGMPSLSTAQCCSLKLETEHEGHHKRVWLCRVSGGVTVETLLSSGKWRTTSGGCGASYASLTSHEEH